MDFSIFEFQGRGQLQAFAFCSINVNPTFAYEHFEDLKNLITFNILSEKLTSFCLLGCFKAFRTALSK